MAQATPATASSGPVWFGSSTAQTLARAATMTAA